MDERLKNWPQRVGGFVASRMRRPNISGHVDGLRDGAIHGWACDRSRPNQRVLVDVFVDDVFVGQRTANGSRPDLAALGLGDGNYGFELTLQQERETKGGSVSVYALSRERWRLATSEAEGALTPISGVKDYLQATFSTLLDLIPQSIESRGGLVCEQRAPAQLIGELFSESPIPSPPPILGRRLCAYLDFNRFKWDLANEFDPSASRADYAAFLKHYLEFYGRARRPLRIPLSAQDVAFLNEGPTRDDPNAQTIAQRLFGNSASPKTLTDEARFEAIYEWAAHRCLNLLGSDCLIPNPQAKLLASHANEQTAFPLSAFMKRFLLGNRFLANLDEESEDDRQLAYLCVCLFSLTAPHYLTLTPRDGLEAFLAPKDRGPPPFETVLTRIFGEIKFNLSHWRAWLAHLGFDCDAWRFRYATSAGDRLHAAALRVSDAQPVDVQIIGPFSRQLGIADSCRALASAVGRLDVSLRLCDFSLDFPNKIRADDRFSLAEPGPAAVNVIHLNLEELPSALAYLPNIWESSLLVGFPYLELQTLHPAQLLGAHLVQEFWSASDFTTRTLSAIKPTHTVGTACRPLRRMGREAARALVYRKGFTKDDFIFFTACDALSGVYRKNPLGAIQAFLRAFPTDRNVKLVVKTHSIDRVVSKPEMAIWERIRNVASECERIVLLDRILDDEEQAALMEGADCLVSLHRAEGFGYLMLEAMMLETPVIATAYSGNMDFCREDTAFLVPYELQPIAASQYPRTTCRQLWADPDIAAAAQMMQIVRHDEVARTAKVVAARDFAEKFYTTDAFATRLAERLTAQLRRPVRLV